MKRSERPFNSLPRILLVCFLIMLVIQISISRWSLFRGELADKPLPEPLASSTYRIASMGSDRLLAYLLAISLQLHDNQSGKHIRYEKLNYQTLADWLDQIYQLNIQSEYPTMLASRIYSQTDDKKRLAMMINFIQKSFIQNPRLHWRRMAEAVILAKYKLGDLELALSIAAQLSSQPASVAMPHWARDLHFLVLGEMNEFEAGIAIIAALLQSGSIINPDERRFLHQKMFEFQQALSEFQP